MPRMTPQQHVEHFFKTAPIEECEAMAERLRPLLEFRQITPLVPKLGRPRKKRTAPPISLLDETMERIIKKDTYT